MWTRRGPEKNRVGKFTSAPQKTKALVRLHYTATRREKMKMMEDTNDPDLCGYLHKQSKWFRVWRNRYFVLKGSKIYFSKSPDAPYHGMIDLDECIAVKPADVLLKRAHSFEIRTPHDSFFLVAPKEKAREDWIGAISRAIVRTSALSATRSFGLTVAEEDADFIL